MRLGPNLEYGSLRSAERGTRNNIVDLSQKKINTTDSKTPYPNGSLEEALYKAMQATWTFAQLFEPCPFVL
jgi:hypothetical protein